MVADRLSWLNRKGWREEADRKVYVVWSVRAQMLLHRSQQRRPHPSERSGQPIQSNAAVKRAISLRKKRGRIIGDNWKDDINHAGNCFGAGIHQLLPP